jgi:CheY-like chemotaxis protein
VDEIEESSRRARDLTRQLLAFSGRQRLQPLPVRMNRVVAEMERLLRRTIGENIRLEVGLQAEDGVVHVDPGQIDQVILNLVVNARDAMPEGGTVTVRTRNVELDEAFCRRHAGAHPGPHVVLSVQDTGIGMDAQTQAHIFEPFFTTKKAGEGTGLGLATVYGIVKQSGGNIWVESEPGRGTTFDVYFPRYAGEEAVTVIEPAATLAQFRGTETILVVEDESPVRELVAAILRDQGYVVLQAESPAAALDLYDRLVTSGGSINLAIVDVVMPGMTGPKLVDRLRVKQLAAPMLPSLPVLPALPVLFMSGYPGDLTPGKGDAFMAKPFTRLQLVREVRRILDGAA